MAEYDYNINILKGATPRFPKVNERSVQLLVNSSIKYGIATGIQAAKPNLFFIEQPDKDQSDAFSYLGTEVFSNMIINGGSYFDADGNEIAYPAIEFQTVLFTVTQTKNIIKTPRNLKLKEGIWSDDIGEKLEKRIIGILNNEKEIKIIN